MESWSIVDTSARYKNAAACGEVIRAMRRERNVTLKALAKKSGLPYQYLSRIERGEVNIPYETLTIIAQSLNVPTRQLVPEDTTITPAQIVPLLDNWSPRKLATLYALLSLWKC
jgi:transcriptional regulator with XRE-family HTH domain